MGHLRNANCQADEDATSRTLNLTHALPTESTHNYLSHSGALRRWEMGDQRTARLPPGGRCKGRWSASGACLAAHSGD